VTQKLFAKKQTLPEYALAGFVGSKSGLFSQLL
jgi:hypothetical protein